MSSSICRLLTKFFDYLWRRFSKLPRTKLTLELLEDLYKFNTDRYDGDSCRLDIYINYAEQILSILFTKHLENSKLHDEIVLTTYVKETQTDDIELYHFLGYACSEDKCEIKFFEKYLQWLLNAQYPELSNKLSKFIIRNGTIPRKCFSDLYVSERCPGEQCFASVRSYKDQLFIRRDCFADKDKIKPMGVSIQLLFDINFQNIDMSILFHCEYDKCNSDDIIMQIKNIFDTVYDPIAILKVFGYKRESEEKQSTIKTNVTLISLTATSTKINENITLNNNAWYTTSTKRMILMGITFCLVFFI
ncbi:hypothetical protein I4U23_016572 [Adineta vaga]|nr:hypothetical protein I4U23_016572 [Adineta vaga]